MKHLVLAIMVAGLSCSHLGIRKARGIKVNFLYFKNNTSEPELARILQEECIRTFKKAGIILDKGGFEIGVEITDYITSPHFYSGEGETTYKSSITVKWKIRYHERVKTLTLSEYEDYPRTGDILKDEEEEESTKRKLISIIAEEAYEHIVRWTSE